MKLITNILIEYLKHNRRLVVPKLGAFIVKQPSGVIRFSELIRNDDGVLRSLLIAYGAKEIEACGMIDRLVFEVHHAISQGESYVIEGLGEFSPGQNNNIVFRHKVEPKTFGGKIKPPIETFEREKVRIMRAMGREIKQDSSTVNRETKPTPKPPKAIDESISIGKPDAYLRGLKYDKDKRRRKEERGDTKRRGGVGAILSALLFTILVIGIVWGVWIWRGGDNNSTVAITTNSIVDTTAMESADTTLRDTTTIEQVKSESEENISYSNSYLNPRF